MHNEGNRPATYGPDGVPRRIVVKSRLARDAYDGNGLLLLRAGTYIDETVDFDRLKQSDVRFAGEKRRNVAATEAAPAPQCSDSQPSACSAEAEVRALEQRIEKATEVRTETTAAVGEVFDRVALDGTVDAERVHETVSTLIDDLIHDSRALLSLVNLKDADNYTFTHSVNVATIAISLGISFGMAAPELDDLGNGALMHDVGKTSTPADILSKPGPLSSREMDVMRQHPIVGARMVAASGGFSNLAVSTVMDHHENMAGQGYPQGKTAETLTLHSQITSVADVYDALTTQRPYRRALSHREAIVIMCNKFAKSFDPYVLGGFIALIGHYPVGSTVTLNNGYTARVITTDPSNPAMPASVLISQRPDGSELENPVLLDLRGRQGISLRSEGEDKTFDSVYRTAVREHRHLVASA